MSILQNVELIFPTISLWSGKASTKDEEVNVTLPEIVSLGCKQIFDPTKLKPMQKYKKQVERLGLKYATRFERGYMAPPKQTADFLNEFGVIKVKFDEEKQRFLDDYAQNCEQFIDSHKHLEGMIKSSLPDIEYLRRQISCSVRTYRVEQASGETIMPADIKQSVFDEVAISCATILKDCYLSTDLQLKGASVNTRMKPVMAKLTSFSFVDSRVKKVITSLDSYLSHISKDVLNKSETDTGMTLFSLLSDSNTLESIIDNDWTPSFSVSTASVTSTAATQIAADDAYF